MHGSIDNVSVKEVGQDWTLTQSTIGNEEATIISTDGSYAAIYQDNVATIGKTYKCSIDVLSISGTMQLRLGSGTDVDITSVGTKTFYINATSSIVELKRKAGAGALDATITNISVKEVGQDWTLGTGWSIADGVAIKEIQAVGDLISNAQITIGKSYKYSYTILNIDDGVVNLFVPNTTYVSNNAAGTFTGVFKATNSGAFTLRSNSTDASITNISVKEITDDTDLPRINYEGFSYQDSLGSEEIVNGDFATDSNWNKGSGWSISGGTANTDGTPSSEIRQNNVTTVGKQYKYSFTISNSGGGVFNARLRNKSTGTPILNFSNEGTYSGTFTSNGTFIDFVTLSNNTASFSIDNVSVKEVSWSRSSTR